MTFGGLSESDIEKISVLLDQYQIQYEVGVDNTMTDANDMSLKNDLRAYAPPSISTHIGQISIDSSAFEEMTPELKEKLLVFGITDEVPEEFAFLDGDSLNPDKDFKASQHILETQREGNQQLLEIKMSFAIVALILIVLLLIPFINSL